MTKSQHKRIAVASMVQNGISRNTKCAIRDGFRSDSHKLQNHSLNKCTNSLQKFEDNPWTEFFNILLQIFISIISYILNNGFHTTTLN